MQIKIEYDNKELTQLIYNDLIKKLGVIEIDPATVVIEVKSKQNYKSEWEPAHFRATYYKST